MGLSERLVNKPWLAVRIGPAEPAHADSIKAILRVPDVAMPYFGTMVSEARLDQYVWEHWSGRVLPPCWQITACCPEDGQVVGAASLTANTLSYFVAPPHWGWGIATQMINYLRSHPDVVARGLPLMAMIYRENRASIALVDKLGFSFAGLQPPKDHSFAGRAMLKYVLPRAPLINRQPGVQPAHECCIHPRTP